MTGTCDTRQEYNNKQKCYCCGILSVVHLKAITHNTLTASTHGEEETF